jgi:hypothetical protein
MHTLDTLLRFSESGILHYDQEVPDGDAFGEDAARCTRTSTLFHELAGTLIAMLTMMQQVLEGNIQTGDQVKNAEPSTLSSCKSLTHASRKTIAAMAHVGVQDPFSIRTEKTAVAEDTSLPRHPAGLESHSVDDYKDSTISLSK